MCTVTCPKGKLIIDNNNRFKPLTPSGRIILNG